MTEKSQDNLFDDIQTFLSTNKEAEKEGILEEQHIQTLIVAFAAARGKDGFDEDEMVKIIRWAEHITVSQTILNLIYTGYVLPNLKEGEDEPVLTLSELGKQALDNNQLT